ncbi:hypothetical protein HD806DRAFT_518599 [Xylariaceae sp. AK1471]|nr:hypothetical protein HD806DRAFT_518599 [Xylariaceae sp. AK1471]
MNSTVYLGLWTNWSRGPILGATLTTTKENGNLLISFTAIFIAFVTSRLWKILFVLRNSLSPEAGLFDIIRVFWAWRKSGIKRTIILLPLILFAVAYLVGFTVAVGDEVLIRSASCGQIQLNATINGVAIKKRSDAEKIYNAANYAQHTIACNKFIVSSLPTVKANYTSGCSFQQKICRNTNSTLRLDSGYIDIYLISRIEKGKPTLFNPIPDLARSDGDLKIIFLSGNGVSFLQEMNDDWYRATKPWRKIYGISAHVDAIYGAAPLFNLTSDDLDPDRLSSSSVSGTRLIWPSLVTLKSPATLYNVVGSFGPRALASQSRFFDGVQFPLPNNQWQIDVLNWWNIVLAALQASWSVVVDTAQGTTDPEFLQSRSPPLNNEEQKMCNSQKIRSPQHISFSFFGLAFTFVTGALIIVASFATEPLLGYLYGSRNYKPYAYLEWISHSSLQLQRLAHEELGLGTWTRFTEEVPITTDLDNTLASLNITDPKHPVLKRPGDTQSSDQELPQGDNLSNSEEQAQTDTESSNEEQLVSSSPHSGSNNTTPVGVVTPIPQPQLEIEGV